MSRGRAFLRQPAAVFGFLTYRLHLMTYIITSAWLNKRRTRGWNCTWQNDARM